MKFHPLTSSLSSFRVKICYFTLSAIITCIFFISLFGLKCMNIWRIVSLTYLVSLQTSGSPQGFKIKFCGFKQCLAANQTWLLIDSGASISDYVYNIYSICDQFSNYLIMIFKGKHMKRPGSTHETNAFWSLFLNVYWIIYKQPMK